MKINSKLPKTFVIFLKTQEDEGYLRYHSNQINHGDIFFTISLERKIQNASKFINLDNVKKNAKRFIRSGKFLEVQVIDEKIRKNIKIKK